ncbi:carbon monoxide dehydrogenase subunit G [Neobacillus sp. MM2021_6]|uniref:CoxG family protein n=1 Tax=Bacillaceae TaxID=186817 RepID=UPI00140971A8|nr:MULTISPECIES: carbon monoxide dehydrogenase subunit G [Bacillaceae]MBO0960933.1 carbon monoxide dehydrogenase subunit G [Neobacillus sp. MM2021_6]NHC20783.1 carbon monoxide dehydrogenase subunit G [Bacillus sp. MM2020_4]
MKIEYQYTFGLPRNIVWKYLMDKDVLRNAIPGCRTFIERSKGVYEAEVEIIIGPLQDVFTLEIRMDHLNPPSSFRLYMKGRGNVGEINGSADMLLQEVGSTTSVNCLAEAQVTGGLALIGQRMLESGAKKIVGSFFQTVEKEIKGSLYQMRKSGR